MLLPITLKYYFLLNTSWQNGHADILTLIANISARVHNKMKQNLDTHTWYIKITENVSNHVEGKIRSDPENACSNHFFVYHTMQIKIYFWLRLAHKPAYMLKHRHTCTQLISPIRKEIKWAKRILRDKQK